MADVEITVRLRRKASDRGGVFAGGKIGGDDLADKVEFGIGRVGHWIIDRWKRNHERHEESRNQRMTLRSIAG